MRIIKKYTNRRLYDTQTSSYINLTQLSKLITQGETIKVVDAKSAADLSQEILLQAFLECPGAQQLFAPELLHRMIRVLTTKPSRQRIKQLTQQLQSIDTVALPEAASKPAQPVPEADDAPPSMHKVVSAAQQPASTQPLPEPTIPSQQEHEPSNPVPEVAEDPKLDSLRSRLAALESRLRRS